MTFPHPPSLALVSLLLGACTAVGPDPSALTAPAVPASYAEGAAASAAPLTAPVGDAAFWTQYRDPLLSELVGRGMTQSLDLRAAEARIRAAQAGVRGAAASQVSGSASASQETGGGFGDGSSASNASASLGAAFVFDLFGGELRARQGAQAALMSAGAGLETARLAWLAEVIAAYGNARHQQQVLAVTRDTIRMRERTVEITRDKVEIGISSGLDLLQAEAQLESARAELPSAEAQFNAQVFRLATLLDEPAAPLLARMQRGAPPLRVPGGFPAGVPADLLRNRPDVRAAEHALAQSLAAVGVAEAALLPSLTLSGRVSDASAGASGWNFGPQVALPVFNRPSLLSSRDRSLAEAELAEINWRAAVTSAVESVQRAQSNLRRHQRRIASLEAALSRQEQAHELAIARFEEGSITLLEMLEVDRTSASARLAVMSARNDAAQEWATLQIAIGSGARAWQGPAAR